VRHALDQSASLPGFRAELFAGWAEVVSPGGLPRRPGRSSREVGVVMMTPGSQSPPQGWSPLSTGGWSPHPGWPPPPPGGWPPRRRALPPFGAADVIGVAAVGVVLTVVDVVFLTVGRHDKNVAVFVFWFCLQALVCISAGVFQALRRRSWWEVAVVASIASMLLAFIILVVANPTAGSADCGSQGPCDTSFGLGAIFICVATFPLFAATTSIGRAVGGIVARVLTRHQPGPAT
jgi:hypothetical protein